jgi:hypothetical protein
MSKPKVTCFLVALLLIAGTGGFLTQARNHQKLGLPGIKTHPITDSIRLRADLPEKVLDYTSEEMADDDIALKMLPGDTSFGQRRYIAPDGFHVDLRVVLMGTDRTSLHKPQFCLPGAGWQIDDKLSEETRVTVDRPCRYDLPVVKLVTQETVNGQKANLNGLYVYWYVCDDGVSASVSGFQRIWWMIERLLRSGVLQRWAYVSCWTTCQPGREQATFERIKKFIADSAPEFQLVPKTPATVITAHQ